MKGQQITVDQAPMTLGREASCDIHLPDTEVALKHAVIEHTPEGLFIRDLNSMNKILVNKREVRESRLKHGDQIELGRTHFLVQARVEAEVAQMDPPSKVSEAVTTLFLLAAMLAVLGIAAYFVWTRMATSPMASPILQPASSPPVSAPSSLLNASTTHPSMATNNILKGASAPMSQEIENMRKDLERVRESVRQAMNEQAVRKIEPAVPAAPPAPTPDNSLRTKTQSLFKEAQAEAARRDYSKADQLLFSIQIIDPDYLPAYVARAQLFERRELPAMALEQWRQIVRLGGENPLAQKARAEIQRLQKMQPADVQLPRRVKIVSAEQTKLLGAEDVDEMRSLTVRLELGAGDKLLDPRDVSVSVAFYDRDLISGEVTPTKASTPRKPITVPGTWNSLEQKTLTATYVRPIELRVQEARAGKQEQFYGFWIRVYYGEALQDEYIKPHHLLQSAAVVSSVKDPATSTAKPTAHSQTAEKP
ncbi:MAG: FHA domain-containing protein [Lentisphaerota bacterium]